MGCQSTLLRLVADWRQGLDRHEYVAAILIELSKAFDRLPHELLLDKLRAYGLNTSACTLVRSYLSNRKQRVKLGPHHSEWANTSKVVPQGSILGPLLFNIFINDIFNVLNKSTQYNYADDNTLSYSHHNLTRFNKIAIQGTPQMAVDKEAICLSRVYSYYPKCNFPLFYV